MKLHILSFYFIIPFISLAQEPLSVSSEIKEVTVFTQGAQVVRTAKTTLPKGEVVLAFKDMSPNLDEKSLQFNSNGDYSIQSINFQIYFDDDKENTKGRMVELNKKLKAIEDEVKTKKNLMSVAYNEEKVLLANTDFGGADGINVTDLQQGVDFVKDRLTQIKNTEQTLLKEIETLNENKQKIINELQKIRLSSSKRKGEVIVKLNSEEAQNINTELSYVVGHAGWSPYYDLKVEDINKPLKIIYKAKVYQSTGEKWGKVKLSLSTGDPYQEGSLPKLNPWFLNFTSHSYTRTSNNNKPTHKGVTGMVSGIIMDKTTGETVPFANIVAYTNKNEIVSGTTSDIDGRFSLSLDYPTVRLEVSFIGYQTYTQYLDRTDKYFSILMSQSTNTLNEVTITKSSQVTTSEDIVNMAVRDVTSSSSQAAGVTYDRYGNTNIKGARDEGEVYFIGGVKVGGNTAQYGDAFKISQNQVTLNYEVDIPYDIPSDGEEYKVLIKEYSLEADYEYKATPKLSKYAYLIANLTDWEKLNLRNGDAGLYYEDTYLGESYLNLDEAGDTLRISLGKDENIMVHRNTIKEEQKKGIFSKTKMLFHYRINVRNNKNLAIKLSINDQFPVSGNSQIDITQLESSNARLDEETGLLNWTFRLEPKQEKKLDLIYEVEFPKDKYVNIR